MKPKLVLEAEAKHRVRRKRKKQSEQDFGLTRKSAIKRLHALMQDASAARSNVSQEMPVQAYGAALEIADALGISSAEVNRVIEQSRSADEFWHELGYQHDDSQEDTDEAYYQKQIMDGIMKDLKSDG